MVGGISRRGFEWGMLIAFAVPLLLALAAYGFASTLYLVRNYNEGWNAYLAAAEASGNPIYSPPAALFTNNYPPLSFYIIGPLSRLVGDAVFAGRAVAWLAFLSTTATIGIILRCLHDDAVAACFAGMLFAACLATLAHDYVGVDDPQMLAHAVALLGMLIYLRARERASAASVFAVIISAALFIKHNVVALPLTLTIWLFVYDRRAALRFVLTGLACAVLGLAICWMIFGHDFFMALLAARRYSLTEAYRFVLPRLSLFEFPVALAILGLLADFRDRFSVLFALYAAVALLIGGVSAAGDGVSINCLFEAIIALSLASGHALARLGISSSSFFASLRIGAIGACGLSVLLAASLKVSADAVLVLPWFKAQRVMEATTLDAVRRLAATPGPALCENLAICYWAKKPMDVDVFNFAQGVLGRTKDLAALEARIASGTYVGAEFGGEPTMPNVLRALRTTLAARYRLVPLPGVGELYLP